MNEQAIINKLNKLGEETLISHLGIEITQAGRDFLCGKMPVDYRTIQPHGLLHGGASAALAETLGSIAASLQVAEHQRVVGVEINCNHVRAATCGYIHGRATPVKIGKTIQVWNIELKDDHGAVICVSRLTAAVIGH